ncbi:MAG TPA: MBL fold metallo-hydrolase [Thermoanaerobaculia bacterium]|nr:MBL fold metallo-hydrolase [Thermoanaerobaculia bacterium]
MEVAAPAQLEFHQFYLTCLAHASYLIGSRGEAAIVDPQRDVEQYLDEARRRGLTIRYIIETHLHADFVSGHRELAERTGAEIVIGAEAHAEFPHRAIRDGDILPLGDLELRALATPGHTPEGISWLVVRDGRPEKVLTGDTLFIGDVGRPDLAGGRGYTPQTMAGMLYDSLQTKLLALPDDVEVWPAHGAGSACGKNISKETSSTIGVQRRTNYALRPMARDEFIALMTSDLAAAPAYFPRDAEINRRGARPLADVTARPLTSAEARQAIADGALALDVREAAAFGASHVAGAINIGLGGQFASWAGTLLPPERPLVLVVQDDARAAEAVMRLARVGMENVAGYVLEQQLDELPRAELAQLLPAELRARQLDVLDVRRAAEFASGHVPGAINIPLHELERRFEEAGPDRPLAVVCAGGYRSSTAASILARHGFTRLFSVTGGTGAWIAAGFGVE